MVWLVHLTLKVDGEEVTRGPNEVYGMEIVAGPVLKVQTLFTWMLGVIELAVMLGVLLPELGHLPVTAIVRL